MSDILSPVKNRFTLFPLKDKEIFDFYKRCEAAFWTAEEIDMSQDRSDFMAMPQGRQHFISHVLAFFAASDGIVNENLVTRFYNDVQSPEARLFYGFQIMIENVHNEVYSLLLDTIISDEDEKLRLLDAINTIPIISKKAKWAEKWLYSDAPFKKRLIAYACVEGIHFSSSFCAIYWLKQKGVMPGLTFSNELIARDESAHTIFATMLHDRLYDKLSKNEITKMVIEAVDLEKEFVEDSLPVSLLGMNCKLMCQYVEQVADNLLEMLHCDKVYGSNNPFPFMDQLAVDVKTNFFEARVGAYQKAGVASSTPYTFTTEGDY